LEKQAQNSQFWQDAKLAGETNQEISALKEELEKLSEIEKELDELGELEKISKDDQSLQNSIEEKYQTLNKKVEKEEFRLFLSGKYDKRNAILQIFSGAGGADAQDWAAMLFRMYERYCQKKGYKTSTIHQSFGEGGGPEGRIGLKSATMEIAGPYVYGFLKRETGVHRLVRLSPFSAQKLRHTSFVLVEVLPEIKKAEEGDINISPDDLKIETFRSSGPGGQNVNRRESAVRITHLPTGIVVACQVERAQAQNKEKATSILYSKLAQLQEEQNKKEIKEIKGGLVSASWGNQIRSYVLHPYKMVKDLRTEVESSNPDEVLNGDLEDFIEAEIKIPAAKNND